MAKQLAGLRLQPGSMLDGGKYQIVRVLGRGGMGSVYEAEQTRTHKRVAIKDIHPTHAHNPEATSRLVREAQAAARVRHPNVVDVYDVISDGDSVCLVMEYLEGEPLSALLRRGRLSPACAVGLLLPVMRAVASAHKHGVIHRDLKPDNIFLAREGDSDVPVPKVLDFGISKLEQRSADQLSLTGSGYLLGTPKYMSFEQLAADRSVDGRADIYAFGVILYQTLTGQLPYDADSLPELALRVATTTPVPPRELQPSLPSAVDAVVMQALHKDRDQRIATMDALIQALEPFAGELTVAPGTPAVTELAPTAPTLLTVPPVAARRRGRELSLGLLLVACLGVGASVMLTQLFRADGQASEKAAEALPTNFPREEGVLPTASASTQSRQTFAGHNADATSDATMQVPDQAANVQPSVPPVPLRKTVVTTSKRPAKAASPSVSQPQSELLSVTPGTIQEVTPVQLVPVPNAKSDGTRGTPRNFRVPKAPRSDDF